MRDSDIKYNLSTDYNRLHKLLKEGIVIIGFTSIGYDSLIQSYSKLITMSYNVDFKVFDIGFTLFEADFDKEAFIKICKKENIRYFGKFDNIK